MANKTTLTLGERIFELTFFAQHSITLHEKTTNTMFISQGPGREIRSQLTAGRFISWSLLHKAWTAGTYTPETEGFAEQLRNHKDLSFRIEQIKEHKLYADAAVSVSSLPPFEFAEIMFEFNWTNAKGEARACARDIPFFVVSPAHFAGDV
jgi:hypothetical protein